MYKISFPVIRIVEIEIFELVQNDFFFVVRAYD